MTITLNGTTGVITPAISGDGSALTNLTSANLTGDLPASDGSALTNLTSSNLTGALPAIDGSALTGVGASTTFAAVGTYALASNNLFPIASAGGAVVAGGNLNPANTQTEGSNIATGYSNATLGSGTWRQMGQLGTYNGNLFLGRRDMSVTIFLRIS